jgi:hypothetical protein
MVLLGLGLLAVSTKPASASEIRCGSVLGPGGTFVLDRDLTCPANPDDHYEPALIVRGATLDLNGHTVSRGGVGSGRGRHYGISAARAMILNSTVTGCTEGVYPELSRRLLNLAERRRSRSIACALAAPRWVCSQRPSGGIL